MCTHFTSQKNMWGEKQRYIENIRRFKINYSENKRPPIQPRAVQKTACAALLSPMMADDPERRAECGGASLRRLLAGGSPPAGRPAPPRAASASLRPPAVAGRRGGSGRSELSVQAWVAMQDPRFPRATRATVAYASPASLPFLFCFYTFFLADAICI